ncbi:L-histidine N(alpha)-methyltransferase [Chloroflexota bacterium]
MDYREQQKTPLNDFKPGQEQFYRDVLQGLQKQHKKLPPKYFYDERGSALYEQICTLDEYYIPQTETLIMNEHIGEIVKRLGLNVFLIEYGSGDCAKTRILLDSMSDLAGYAPIDISRDQLIRVTKELTSDYPGLYILPVCADYTKDYSIPVPERHINRRVVYFPGSSIGNFEPEIAAGFLRHIAEVCRPGGALLIGVDLKKDSTVLYNAYNDRQGVTAAFNLNLLERINRELQGDFQLDSFRHYAFYNPGQGRIEMHLISLKEQAVHLDNVAIPFGCGESIHTENSYKYTLNEFADIAGTAGFNVEQVWTDKQNGLVSSTW